MKNENLTKQILDKYNIRANKSLGQNFLADETKIDEIIQKSDIKDDECIIEIGPGPGILTVQLLEKAKKVIAIELDKKMVDVLNKRFAKEIQSGKLIIINEDVLKVDIDSLIQNYAQNSKAKVIANLPYYITTPIITNLLEKTNKISNIIVMVQKEVATRLTAKPGSKQTGAITYLIDYNCNAKAILDVPSKCFIPAPKVDSQVISLEVIKKDFDVDKGHLFGLIKKSFLNRRKTLVNNLVSSNMVADKESAKKIINDIGLDENIRPENLTLQNFVDLSNSIKKLKGDKN